VRRGRVRGGRGKSQRGGEGKVVDSRNNQSHSVNAKKVYHLFKGMDHGTKSRGGRKVHRAGGRRT